MGILEDVPIKVGDFYVPIDFVVLDMAEDSHTQIILGSPFLATAGCKIDIKEGKLTFDVGEHHVEFGLFDDLKPASTFACCGCEIVESNEPVDLHDTSLNDASSISCALFKGLGLDNVKEDSFPPNIVETEPNAVDEGYLSTYCRFITFWMSIPPVSGGVQEVDADMKFEFGPYDGDGPKMSVRLYLKLWKLLRFEKDLNPELLRWFPLLRQFYVEIVDKG